MRWNWDFIRGERTEMPRRKRLAGSKMISVNGLAHEIQGGHLSDMEVAGQVRMLHRSQLDHESVCTLARDRIVYLADRLGEIENPAAEDLGHDICEASFTGDLRAFADRAESHTGMDRDFDLEIWNALNGPKHAFDRISPGLPKYTDSVDHARSLFPWQPHPCANLKTNLVQSGVNKFYCFVEFTWPSTEVQGRARDEARATLACALRAIQRTNEELAPFRSNPQHTASRPLEKRTPAC
jgi:hypothetical protein